MNQLARWRRPLLFALLPWVLFYGTYFLSRYATFSLTLALHSTVIRELIRSAVAQRFPRLGGPIALATSGPNCSAGCSFLLLEEAVRSVAAPIVADPCTHITDATLIQGIDRHRFGCDGISSPFRAVVRCAASGSAGLEILLDGSFR